MTTYNTGNPVPSAAIKDLYDNAENIDKAVNGTDLTWPDRLGVVRKSWAGIESDIANATGINATGWETGLNQLSTITPTSAGQRATVPESDTGTHTDPATGATVQNSGTYASVLYNGNLVWQWISADSFSTKANKSQVGNTHIVGWDNPTATGQAAEAAQTWFVNQTFETDALIKVSNIPVKAAIVAAIVVATKSDDNKWTLVSADDVRLNTGDNSIPHRIPVPAGAYMGVYSPKAVLYFDAPTTSEVSVFQVDGLPSVDTEQVTELTGYRFEFSLEVEDGIVAAKADADDVGSIYTVGWSDLGNGAGNATSNCTWFFGHRYVRDTKIQQLNVITSGPSPGKLIVGRRNAALTGWDYVSSVDISLSDGSNRITVDLDVPAGCYLGVYTELGVLRVTSTDSATIKQATYKVVGIPDTDSAQEVLSGYRFEMNVVAVEGYLASLGELVQQNIANSHVEASETIELFGKSSPTLLAWDSEVIGSTPDNLKLLGSATASVTSDGDLAIIADYTSTANKAVIKRQFAEGKIAFTVLKGNAFRLGWRVKADGSGWYIWSNDGASVKAGYRSADNATSSPLIDTTTLAGSTGDYINIEIISGPAVSAATFELRSWVDGTARPSAASATGTYGTDGSSQKQSNSGFITVGSNGTSPVTLRRISVEDGGNGDAFSLSQVSFIGRWFPRYEGGALVMGTIRQGSSFRFKVSGTDTVSVIAEYSSATTLDPILGVYVDGEFSSYVTLANGTAVDLLTGLEATKTYSVECIIRGINESDDKWRHGAGLLLRQLGVATGGLISPWPDNRPKILWIGDSITEGIVARGTPSTPTNSGGDTCYARLVSESLQMSPVMNGFGGTGLVKVGTGSMANAQDNAFAYMYDRPIPATENINCIVINLGTNDTSVESATFQTTYAAWIRKLYRVYRPMKIYCMRPFNGTHADDVSAAVTALTDLPVSYIDTTGWITSSDTTDGTHLTVAGHKKAAGDLSPLLQSDMQSLLH